MMNQKNNPPEVCPICGNDVPRKARVCPECGADHNSGWKEGATAADGIDSGDDEFNYEEFVAEEFGGGAKPKGIKTIWWIVAVILLLVTVGTWLAEIL